MDGVAISIIGRPRPLPGHDTPNPAHNTYTLKCEEPHNKAVFRGTKVPQHIIDEAIRTGVYRDPAFFSTTTKPKVAEMFMQRLKPEPGETRVLFEIENASGSNIRPMSMYATQDEILFKSGVEFDVVKRTEHPDGSYTIKLRQRE